MSMMETITNILPQIGIASAAAVAAVSTALFLVKAKRNAPLTQKEADILWKLHKQNTHCKSHKYKTHTGKHGEMTGFKCQCGYRYAQKRPLI